MESSLAESNLQRKLNLRRKTLAVIDGQESPISTESLEWNFESFKTLLPSSLKTFKQV